MSDKTSAANVYTMNEAFVSGRSVREAVMGESHVERSLKAAVEEGNTDLQQLVTEYAWGTVWSRQGLDRKQRSLATVSMLVALNRSQELVGHLRGALEKGLSPEELHELMGHASVYCGFPAALDARRKRAEVLDERGR